MLDIPYHKIVLQLFKYTLSQGKLSRNDGRGILFPQLPLPHNTLYKLEIWADLPLRKNKRWFVRANYNVNIRLIC